MDVSSVPVNSALVPQIGQANYNCASVGAQTDTPELSGGDRCTLQKAQGDGEEFSHNRYCARQAYLGQTNNSDKTHPSENDAENSGDPKASTQKAGQRELTEEERSTVEKLKKEDADTKAHERAHQSAGGQYASAPSYEYRRGPDGKNYAVAGHVNIDVSEEDTPEATLRKMQTVISAAKAPADPSSQDMKVAAQATQKAAEARMEMAQEKDPAHEDEKESSKQERTDEIDANKQDSEV